MNAYCWDCPDREACHQGVSCETSKRFAAAAIVYQQKMKGKTTIMANNSKTTVTPADVAAQAAEEKLVVPAQGEKVTEETVVEEKKVEVTEEPALTVIEGGKKSLKERLTALAKKVEENKKPVIAVGIAVAAATVAVAKVIAKRSLEKEEAKEYMVVTDPETGDAVKVEKATELTIPEKNDEAAA